MSTSLRDLSCWIRARAPGSSRWRLRPGLRRRSGFRWLTLDMRADVTHEDRTLFTPVERHTIRVNRALTKANDYRRLGDDRLLFHESGCGLQGRRHVRLSLDDHAVVESHFVGFVVVNAVGGIKRRHFAVLASYLSTDLVEIHDVCILGCLRRGVGNEIVGVLLLVHALDARFKHFERACLKRDRANSGFAPAVIDRDAQKRRERIEAHNSGRSEREYGFQRADARAVALGALKLAGPVIAALA